MDEEVFFLNRQLFALSGKNFGYFGENASGLRFKFSIRFVAAIFSFAVLSIT